MTYDYQVIEHFSDEDPPEPFGFVALTSHPAAGDVIKLKWLDGRDAYDVRIDRVVGNHVLHVRALKGGGR